TGTIGGGWSDGETGGTLTESGSASIALSATNDASYSGSGSFTASGAMSGGGTIEESGHQHVGDDPTLTDDIESDGTLAPEGATGSGTTTGSTFWSYTGSGTYTDGNAGSGIRFFLPGSATPTITTNVTGSAWASGKVTTTDNRSWTGTEDASDVWSYAGSGSTTRNKT